jgi:hypothetical protein
LSTPTIEAGTAATTIGGTILVGNLVPTGSVAITVGGATINAAIGANGQFSASVTTSSLSPANSPYLIEFGYPGDTDFTAVAGASSLAVHDTTAPVISGVSATPNVLGPPNHKMIDVTVAYQATDLVGVSACSLSVASNEPANGTGDGNTATDWVVVDAHHVQLRAERAGTGSGRIYTLTVTCADAAHNVSTATTLVGVAK